MKEAINSKIQNKMPPCLMAKKTPSDTDLMFQFYLPNKSLNHRRAKQELRYMPTISIS